jgi:hypothetical protein
MVKICRKCNNSNNFSKIHKSSLTTNTVNMLKKNNKFFNSNLDIKTKLTPFQPQNGRIEVEINVGILGSKRYLYYFAAESKKGNPLHFLEEEKAYGKFNNSGLITIPSSGKIKVYIKCPQNYMEKGFWLPHIHFILSNKNRTKWQPYLYTKLVMCNVEKKFIKKVIKTNDFLIINALPMSEYIKAHISTSLPLPFDSLNHLTDKEIVKYLKKMLIHCPKINKYVHKNIGNIYKIPIIVYCYNDKCNGSTKVIERLWKIGFKNIKRYKGGIMDWLK